jgi:hypothetical protein
VCTIEETERNLPLTAFLKNKKDDSRAPVGDNDSHGNNLVEDEEDFLLNDDDDLLFEKAGAEVLIEDEDLKYEDL